jgi:ferritin-like metal-binding protein YciE
VEHYEISRYGTLAAWAEKLGMREAAELLETTLEEEKNTDLKLSELALSEINVEASSGDGDKRASRGSHSKRDSGASARRG